MNDDGHCPIAGFGKVRVQRVIVDELPVLDQKAVDRPHGRDRELLPATLRQVDNGRAIDRVHVQQRVTRGVVEEGIAQRRPADHDGSVVLRWIGPGRQPIGRLQDGLHRSGRSIGFDALAGLFRVGNRSIERGQQDDDHSQNRDEDHHRFPPRIPGLDEARGLVRIGLGGQNPHRPLVRPDLDHPSS